MALHRTETVKLYFTEDEKRVIVEMSRRRGLGLNAFFRNALWDLHPQIFDADVQDRVKTRRESFDLKATVVRADNLEELNR